MQLTGLPVGNDLAAVLFANGNMSGYINQTSTTLGNPSIGTDISVIVINSSMLQLSKEELVKKVVQELSAVRPKPTPVYSVKDSTLMLWTRGIVQFYPGYLTLQQSLRNPVDRIFFAGDYTHDPSLTGAAWSGERAAKSILSLPTNCPSPTCAFKLV